MADITLVEGGNIPVVLTQDNVELVIGTAIPMPGVLGTPSSGSWDAGYVTGLGAQDSIADAIDQINRGLADVAHTDPVLGTPTAGAYSPDGYIGSLAPSTRLADAADAINLALRAIATLAETPGEHALGNPAGGWQPGYGIFDANTVIADAVNILNQGVLEVSEGVGAAETAADAAQQAANQAASNATAAQNAAAAAQTASEDAIEAAGDAGEQATDAYNLATTASGQLATALANAAAAQSTANTALTQAGNAQTSATNANSSANAAQATADAAVAQAAAARGTADAAQALANAPGQRPAGLPTGGNWGTGIGSYSASSLITDILNDLNIRALSVSGLADEANAASAAAQDDATEAMAAAQDATGAAATALSVANAAQALAQAPGQRPMGEPTDGNFADGQIALTTSTLITDAIDGLNEALLAINGLATAAQTAAADPAGHAIGTATDGSWADGYVALTGSTTIRDAIDGLNEGLLAVSAGGSASQQALGAPTDGSWADGFIAITDASKIVDAIDGLNEALASINSGFASYLNAGTGVHLPADEKVYWEGRARISSPVDQMLQLLPAAGNSNGAALGLGWIFGLNDGTGASLVRAGNGILRVMTGNQGANGTLQAATFQTTNASGSTNFGDANGVMGMALNAATQVLTLATNGSVGMSMATDQATTFSKSITLPAAASNLLWTGRGSMGTTADGIFQLLNNAGTSAALVLGPATSSGVRIFQSGSSTLAVGAGNSASPNGSLSLAGITATGTINSASLQHYNASGSMLTMSQALSGTTTSTISGTSYTYVIPNTTSGAVLRSLSVRVITAMAGTGLTGFNIGDTGSTPIGGLATSPTAFGSNIAPAVGSTTTIGSYTIQIPRAYAGNITITITPQGAATFTNGALRLSWVIDTIAAPTS